MLNFEFYGFPVNKCAFMYLTLPQINNRKNTNQE